MGGDCSGGTRNGIIKYASHDLGCPRVPAGYPFPGLPQLNQDHKANVVLTIEHMSKQLLQSGRFGESRMLSVVSRGISETDDHSAITILMPVAGLIVQASS